MLFYFFITLVNHIVNVFLIGYTVGWVNLYKKFEIVKYTVCGKLILPTKKWKGIFFLNLGPQLA